MNPPESPKLQAPTGLELPVPSEGSPQQADSLRRFLELESERLRGRHRSGLGGLETMLARTHHVDQALSQSCRLASSTVEDGSARVSSALSVVALGGYGRAELAPHSGLDVLFLHSGGEAEWASVFADEVARLIRGAGLSIQRTSRSVSDAVVMTRGDLRSRTALLEARLVWGSRELFESLIRELESRFLGNRRGVSAFLSEMKQDVSERHSKSWCTVAVLEPDVKEGVGCLRDLHSLQWLAFARFGSRGLASLSAGGMVSKAEYDTLRTAAGFLARVRNELHFSAGRKQDVLALELHQPVAEALGFAPRRGLLASEVFMKEFYQSARAIDSVCREFRRRYIEHPSPRVVFGVRRPHIRGSFEVQNGELQPPRPDGSAGNEVFLEAFTISQEEKLPLSEKLQRVLRSRLSTIDRAYRRSPEVREAFLKLLGRRGRVGPVLRAMHETGFLGRYLPEWSRVTHLVEHDHCHRFTVDEHTLRSVETLDAVARGTSAQGLPFGRILDGITDARPLYVGALLHEIEKGFGGGHPAPKPRLADRVLARLGVAPALSASVRFLVEMHHELSRISQRRDLSEPGLVAAFARKVGSLERLDLLVLLTFADQFALGQGNWSEWKGALFLELYGRTRAILAGSTLEEGAGDAARARAVEILKRKFPVRDLERHFAGLPERYLRTNDAGQMVRHYRLLSRRAEAPVALDWQDVEGDGTTELTVTAGDRRGLLARIAGTLTANGVNILSVDLFSREDGQVLDTFRLGEGSPPRSLRAATKSRIAADLGQAVTGELDVGAAVSSWLASHRQPEKRSPARSARGPAIRFDNEASGSSTVVEVRAPDRPGVAFTLADALARLGLDISFAKLATDRARALDVFYVTDGWQKLSGERLKEVEQALLESLSRLESGPATAEPVEAPGSA